MRKRHNFNMLYPVSNVLIILSLIIFLTSCSNNNERKQTKFIYKYPADILLISCNKPKLSGNTWRDIAILAKQRGLALDICANQIDEIIKWRKNIDIKSSN
ncbi:Rz1-like lysis system protein LysC [Yersinia proxima]|uniref:Rz1-like lysis system protein LysC n=2 Tax=Yersinia proxima TaxID=2890316 RepID=UPI003D68B207